MAAARDGNRRDHVADSSARVRTAKVSKRTNVLLITLCSVRPDHMSAYGYWRDTTPFLKTLADESVVFEQAASQWPKTVPAFASLMTEKFGHSNGVMRFTTGKVLDESHETLAEMMAAAGYDTAAFVSTSALNEKTKIFQGFETADRTYLESKPFETTTGNALAWMVERRDKPFFVWVHYNNAHYPYHGGGGLPDVFWTTNTTTQAGGSNTTCP